MADADAPTETRIAPLHLRHMSGDVKPAPNLGTGEAEPAYNHIYVVRIVDANPKNFRAEVYDVPPNGLSEQAKLLWSHVATAETNGTPVPGAVLDKLDLRLNTAKGALVIFHLVDLDAVFEDPTNSGSDRGLVLTDDSGMIFQPRWVEGRNKAVSVILKGHPDPLLPAPPNPQPAVGRYGLRIKFVIPAKDPRSSDETISYVEIDPKVENQGEGGPL